MPRVAAALIVTALLTLSLGPSPASARYGDGPGYADSYLALGSEYVHSSLGYADIYLGSSLASWGFDWYWPPLWPGYWWPGWPGWPGWWWPRPPTPRQPCILIYPPPPGCF
jgi:hypothetical protein